MDAIRWCIDYLKVYNGLKTGFNLPIEKEFRALMNITMPVDLAEEYYLKQGQALKEINARRGAVDALSLPRQEPHLALYRGDITRLKVDAIVDAGNEKLLGCFIPLHSCVDNAIFSFAGLEVRRDLLEVMEKQGHDEPEGKVKVTKGYNLPSPYIFHTVGPKGYDPKWEGKLTDCYLSCLRQAERMNLRSLAFCSISTGVYGYPIEEAAPLALKLTKEYLKTSSLELVVFVTYSDYDARVYGDSLRCLEEKERFLQVK